MATSNKRFNLEGPGPPDPLDPLLPAIVVERGAECSGFHSEFVFHTPEPFTDKKSVVRFILASKEKMTD